MCNISIMFTLWVLSPAFYYLLFPIFKTLTVEFYFFWHIHGIDVQGLVLRSEQIVDMWRRLGRERLGYSKKWNVHCL